VTSEGITDVLVDVCPYSGHADLRGIQRDLHKRPLDSVSLCDFLVHGFVAPPFTIRQGIKTSSSGFRSKGGTLALDPVAWTRRDKERHWRSGTDWVRAYHERLVQAVTRTCRAQVGPVLLQSGGKDSTSLAIALAEARPDATCLTYVGGGKENEAASARTVAARLGLKHGILVCDPGRAWDRYVQLVPDLPLLTGDFAFLSYVDILSELRIQGADGVIDGLGSDVYFGTPVSRQSRFLAAAAHTLPLPRRWSELPLLRRSFALCYCVSTLGMSEVERFFPGSRFSLSDADEILGLQHSRASRDRLMSRTSTFVDQQSLSMRRAYATLLSESGGAFAKGQYATSALDMSIAYPFCDEALVSWLSRDLPSGLRIDERTGMNKVIVRQHIAGRFDGLPYVKAKGSFRFDVRGLASARFDEVRGMATEVGGVLPGAAAWLDRNRPYLDNKFHASRFYLLAVLIPWIRAHALT
jgi:asparagine synthetase B (glutamine-hydrolysing)